MVRIEEMEDKLDDFFKDSERFKRLKLLVDLKQVEDLKVQSPKMSFDKPKLKKGQKASKFIKSNPNKKSLF